ncbi:MAG TPA: SCO family protein, partial [Longimicrobiales bacterium]|nr:SCO family protein [Longimicrobiales bacterium]
MRRALCLLSLAGALTGASCSAPADAPRDPDALALLGTVPVTPLDKVSFTLTDTRGRPFDFRAETDGHITLLFFGYTFCPDICPVHMATLAAALTELDPGVRQDVRVVFVTVDPQRDTPERLGG